MKLLIDEDLHRSIASVFKSLGFTVFDVRDVGLRGQPDTEVFAWAEEQEAILISSDLGFANIVDFPQHRGMIILRFPNEISTEAINREVKRLLRNLRQEDYKGKLIIISPGKIRVREPGLRKMSQ